ncbi:MAG: bifunctional phosphoglucose/phosphomannose isomerase [Anaerolineae bacterium]|nr:MAG: bifunctional phosphoglucose/phosphomannose isomerase [Anaerolineae bacterium]
MNLDDLNLFTQIDTENMLAEIDALPEQLENAWETGHTMSLPRWEGIRQVVIAGMGGSAIGADLLAAYIAPQCNVPVVVHRDYDLPAWARGEQTLMIASSHSGNTEETLSAFEAAVENGCRTLAVCTGGELALRAEQTGAALWRFEHQGQPRAAVGYSFGLLLAALSRLKLIPDPAPDLAETLIELRAGRESLGAASPVLENPAKRLAGQCINRWLVILGAGFLAPVARRWKGQVSEIAKTWAQFEALPEADHNTLAGVVNPEALLTQTMVLFLRASGNHPRNRLRVDLTKEIFMLEGLGTDFVDARGDSRLAQMWTLLQFGDYFAYYLAMIYQVDPTPVAAIEGLKARLKER